MNRNSVIRCVVASLLVANTLFSPQTLMSEELADSVPEHHDNGISPMRFVIPASLVSVGAFAVCNRKLNKINHAVRDRFEHIRGECRFHADDYIQYLPAFAYIGLDGIGIEAEHTFRERLVAGTAAYVIMASVVNITKYSIHERRPDSSTRNSFPSGHAATAFTGAELVRMEYGWVAGVGAYTIASGVAFLRLYNDRHWLNDVVAGMGIGILSARLAYILLPYCKKWLGWTDKKTITASIIPTCNLAQNTIVLNGRIVF